MTSAVTVTQAFTFDAAHVLPWHQGKCSRVHGHTYRLEVSIAGNLNADGIVIDFADIKRAVIERVIDSLDHTLLNDTIDNPTAEIVALHILGALRDDGLDVTAVRLWETPDSSVEVRP
jgi:6-pyruvoyltetrahydropterin/6-carboxytetrahydropterin synthase